MMLNTNANATVSDTIPSLLPFSADSSFALAYGGANQLIAPDWIESAGCIGDEDRLVDCPGANFVASCSTNYYSGMGVGLACQKQV